MAIALACLVAAVALANAQSLAPTMSPTSCPGNQTYLTGQFQTLPACTSCENGTINIPFQIATSELDCAEICDQPGIDAFVFTATGPHANGCWCKVFTSSPTTSPSLSPTTLGPTTASPATIAPITESPITSSPTSSSPATVNPSSEAPTLNPTTSPSTKIPTTAPTTKIPTTAPTSASPATMSPTVTFSPSTSEPTSTRNPSTISPVTMSPSISPVTRVPTMTTNPTATRNPSTSMPSTSEPFTSVPSSSPSTSVPSVSSPVAVTVLLQDSENGSSEEADYGLRYDEDMDSSVEYDYEYGKGSQIEDSYTEYDHAYGEEHRPNRRAVFVQNIPENNNQFCECPYDTITSLSSGVPASEYTIGVYVNVRKCVTASPTTVSPVTQSPVTLTPTGSPTETCTLPTLEGARLTTAASTFLVTFSGDTNRAGMTPADTSCAQVFTTATVATFGTGNSCLWTDDRTLQVTLGTSPSIVVGSSMVLLSNTISRSSVICSTFLPITSTTLLVPLVPPVVNAVISAPSEIGDCSSNVAFDAGDSTGAGGRDFTFSWSRVSLTPAGLSTNLDSLDTIIDANTGSILNLDPEVIDQASDGTLNLVVLIVNVTVTNWLSGTDFATFTLTVNKLGAVPNVQFAAPKTLSVFRTDEVVVGTILTPEESTSSCVTGNVIYDWQLTSGQSLTIDSNEASTSAISFAPNTLLVGETYIFQLTVRYDITNAPSSVQTTEVFVAWQPPTVVLLNCDRVVDIGPNAGILEIDASNTFDTDYPSNGLTEISLSWSCDRGGAANCQIDTFLQLADQQASLTINANILDFTNGSVADGLSLERGFAELPYTFTVTATQVLTGGSSSASCDIWTRKLDIDIVVLFIDTEGPDSQNSVSFAATSPSDVASVNLLASSIVSYQWDCKLPEGTDCSFDLSGAIARSPSTSQTFIIDSSFLTRGVTYVWGVTGFDNTNTAVARAITEFSLQPSPSSGTCVVSPTSGTAYTTLFTFTCSGWSGGDTIRYKFTASFGVIFRSTGLSASYTTLLPDTVSSIAVTISNEGGGSTTTTVNVDVQTPSIIPSTLLSEQVAAAQSACANGDVSTTSISVSNALALSSSLSSEASSLINAASCLAQASAVSTDNIEATLSIIDQILTSAESEGIIIESSVASSALTAIQDQLDATSDGRATFTPEIAESATDVVGQLISSSVADGSGTISQSIQSTISKIGRSAGTVLSDGQDALTFAPTSSQVSITSQKLATSVTADPLVFTDGTNSASLSLAGYNAAFGSIANPVVVFSSVPNFYPNSGSSLSSLVTLEAFSNGSSNAEEISPSTISGGVTYTLATSEEADGACLNVDSSGAFQSSLCSSQSTSSLLTDVCLCDTITSVQSVLQVLDGDDDDDFSIYVIVVLASVWAAYFTVLIFSSICRKEDGNLDSAEQENDFLLQYFFYYPINLLYETLIWDKKAVDAIEILKEKVSKTAVPKKSIALWQQKQQGELKQEDSIMTQDIEAVSGFQHDGLVSGRITIAQKYSLFPEEKMKNAIVNRCKHFVRLTGSEAAAVVLECQRREQRFLRRTGNFLKHSHVPQEEIDNIVATRWALLSQSAHQKIEWEKRRKQLEGSRKVTIGYREFMRLNHEWESIFSHRRIDPYTSIWRSNVLLISLLLVIVFSLGFSELIDTSDVIGNIIVNALIVAGIVYAITVLLISMARRVGYLAWEVRLLDIREGTCVMTSDYRNENQNIIREGEDKENRVRTLNILRVCAWLTFILTALLLTFGIVWIELSRGAFKIQFFLTTILAEIIRVAILSPIIILIKATIVFGNREGRGRLQDMAMQADNLRAIKALDVFIRVCRGFKLRKDYFKKMQRLVSTTNKLVLTRFREVIPTVMKDAIVLNFANKVKGAKGQRVVSDMDQKVVRKKKKGDFDEDNSDDDPVDPPIPPIVSKWKDLGYESKDRRRVKAGHVSTLLVEVLDPLIDDINPQSEEYKMWHPKIEEPAILKPKTNDNNINVDIKHGDHRDDKSIRSTGSYPKKILPKHGDHRDDKSIRSTGSYPEKILPKKQESPRFSVSFQGKTEKARRSSAHLRSLQREVELQKQLEELKNKNKALEDKMRADEAKRNEDINQLRRDFENSNRNLRDDFVEKQKALLAEQKKQQLEAHAKVLETQKRMQEDAERRQRKILQDQREYEERNRRSTMSRRQQEIEFANERKRMQELEKINAEKARLAEKERELEEKSKAIEAEKKAFIVPNFVPRKPKQGQRSARHMLQSQNSGRSDGSSFGGLEGRPKSGRIPFRVTSSRLKVVPPDSPMTERTFASDEQSEATQHSIANFFLEFMDD